VASWLVAVALVVLGSLLPGLIDSPETSGRLGGDPSALGSGSGTGGNGGPGGAIDPDTGPEGDLDGNGIRDDLEDAPSRDIDGDGIPDRDIDGDGILDVDLDGDGIPDIDRDGDGVPDTGSVTSVPPTAADGSTVDQGSGAGTERTDGSTLLKVLGVALGVLLVAALIALAVRAVVRERARRQALAARPWPIRLAERLEREGSRRGRSRRRDEPVATYVGALGVTVLPHDDLGAVGTTLSAGLFGPVPLPEGDAVWAVRVVDDAVAANPVPTWRDTARQRLRR
jgi:hypothetical protein